jgi:hypothetical protein
MKNCPEGKIINPATGRCVDALGPIAKKLEREASGIEYSGACPEDLVFNPLTGRCIGYKREAKVYDSVCPEGYVINPETGRCVKAGGKLGQALSGTKAPKAVRAPSEYNKFVSRALVHIKEEHPTSTPQERIKMAAALWSQAKASA